MLTSPTGLSVDATYVQSLRHLKAVVSCTANGAFNAIRNTDLAAGNETGAGVGRADAGLCLFTPESKLATHATAYRELRCAHPASLVL
jgi:hypothetical protein